MSPSRMVRDLRKISNIDGLAANRASYEVVVLGGGHWLVPLAEDYSVNVEEFRHSHRTPRGNKRSRAISAQANDSGTVGASKS